MTPHETLKVYSPFDGKLIKEIPMSGKKEAEAALKIAYDLFLDRKRMDSRA